jgi:predicted N-acetyltransferase YhbS
VTALPGGLVLRTATPADVPQAAELLVARGEPADGTDLELVVGTEGHEPVAVVVDGEQVVSTLTLLDEAVHLGGVAVPAGQVELVATDRAYEGRGLVRALMAWAHARSRERGHLVQVMIGIPYFYRRFGYEYVAPMAPWRRLTSVPAAPTGVEVRRATLADIPAMDALQTAAQRDADVRMGHSPACWRWLVERDASEQWLAVDATDGAVRGVARIVPPPEEPVVAELAAHDDAAALALVAHAAGRADGTLTVQQRASTPGVVSDLLGEVVDEGEWYYGRVEQLGPLLAHLAPLLVRRLEGAGLADRDHEVLLSTYRQHLRFQIGPSGFEVVAAGGPEQAPVSRGGSGVPPDAVASLLLGPYGSVGLEERLPDCNLGTQRELMAALFPPVVADLLTFYLPQ